MSAEKGEYLSIKREMSEIRHGSGKQKLSAGFMALGKGLYNTGKWAAKEGYPRFMEAAERQIKEASKEKGRNEV